LAASVVFVAALAAFPTEARAAVIISVTDVTKRLIGYGAQLVTSAIDLVVVDDMKDLMRDIDVQYDRLARQKHANYETDHSLLSESNVVHKDASAYINSFRGVSADISSRYPELSPTPALFADKTHPEMYKERAGSFKERMKLAIVGNARAVGDILSGESDVNKMALVSKGAYGYTRQMQASALSANYLNQELTRLQADIDRRITLEAELAMNEQRERTEELAAFGAAVGSWSDPDEGADY
jgi:hypothetical protein